MAWGGNFTHSGRLALPNKTSLGVLLCTAQGQFWGPVSPETTPEPPSIQRPQTLFAHIKLLLAVFYCI